MCIKTDLAIWAICEGIMPIGLAKVNNSLTIPNFIDYGGV